VAPTPVPQRVGWGLRLSNEPPDANAVCGRRPSCSRLRRRRSLSCPPTTSQNHLHLCQINAKNFALVTIGSPPDHSDRGQLLYALSWPHHLVGPFSCAQIDLARCRPGLHGLNARTETWLSERRPHQSNQAGRAPKAGPPPKKRPRPVLRGRNGVGAKKAEAASPFTPPP
jgi:hypothetical protein